MNRKIVSDLKSSILALGLTLKDHSQPFKIVGTGFFIHEDGFFLTADHVGIDMEKILKKITRASCDSLDWNECWRCRIYDDNDLCRSGWYWIAYRFH